MWLPRRPGCLSISHWAVGQIPWGLQVHCQCITGLGQGCSLIWRDNASASGGGMEIWLGGLAREAVKQPIIRMKHLCVKVKKVDGVTQVGSSSTWRQRWWCTNIEISGSITRRDDGSPRIVWYVDFWEHVHVETARSWVQECQESLGGWINGPSFSHHCEIFDLTLPKKPPRCVGEGELKSVSKDTRQKWK